MKKSMLLKIWAVPVLFLTVLSSASAFDIGISAVNTFTNTDDGNSFTMNVSPWFSSIIGEYSDMYVSGIFRLDIDEDDTEFLFDLGRTQLSLRSPKAVVFDIGRLSFSDASALAVNGLYDGARLSAPLSFGRFIAGSYYTGFLNKERVSMVLSNADAEDFLDDDIKFAPGRILVSAQLDAPSMIPRTQLGLGFTGQFDMREKEDALNSQYISARIVNSVSSIISLNTRAVLAFVQAYEEDSEFSAAADFELSLYLPGDAADRIYAGVLFASGEEGSFTSYLPINAPSVGSVYNPQASGIKAVRAGYFIRLQDAFSADISARVFMRHGDAFYDADLDPEKNDQYLGFEAAASLLFTPFSDLSFLMDGGVFMPDSSAFLKSDPRYKISISALLSL